MTIDQQVALDEALVPHATRLRIRKSNFRLRSYITSKESNLQLVYDVLRLTPFYKVFLVTADVPEIYMQEFWATAIVHHHSICFKMNNKKRIVNLKNSAAYKEYYAIASGAAPPKTKESFKKTQSSSDTTITPPTTAGIRLSTAAKGKQYAKSSKAKGLSMLSKVAMTEAEQMKLATKRSLQQTHLSQASGSSADEGTIDDKSDDQEDEDDQDDDDQDDNDDDQGTNNDDDDFVHPKLSIHEKEAKDEEIFDLIIQTPKNSDDEGNDDASLDTHMTLTPINPDGQQQSSSMSSQFVTSMLNPSPNAGIDSLLELAPQVDVQASTTFAPLTLTAPTLPPPTIPIISQVLQAPTPPTTDPSTFLQYLSNFGSLFGFHHRLKTLEANFTEFVQKNQFDGVVSSIPDIVERYKDQRMNKAVKVASDTV
uniref:Uncharacterized protein n=1 Tax=Tanacetum cinerariifolium TaxID=118510 RepID=A0A6L2MPS2_TANCI|nr:hypothetical protein [Tanacetum cinerariifolium]